MLTLELVIIEFIVLATICFVLLRYYKGPMVHMDVMITVYLSWVLGLSGILFLPYDIATTIVNKSHSSTLDYTWTFIYWSTFALAWLVLPLQMEYHKSGEFTFSGKMYDAIRKNFVMGLLAMIAGIGYLIYMELTTGLTLDQVIAFSMAMSSTYGIIIIIVLMGNGLVAVPRRLWQISNDERELRRLYLSAVNTENAFQDARYALEDCEYEVYEAIDALQYKIYEQSNYMNNNSNTNSSTNITSGSKEVSSDTIYSVRLLQEKITKFEFAARSTSRQNMRPRMGTTMNIPSSSSMTTVSSTAYTSPNKKGLNYYKNMTPTDRTKYENEINYILNKKTLINLHTRLIMTQMRAASCERRWKNLLVSIQSIEERMQYLSTGHYSANPTTTNNHSTTITATAGGDSPIRDTTSTTGSLISSQSWFYIDTHDSSTHAHLPHITGNNTTNTGYSTSNNQVVQTGSTSYLCCCCTRIGQCIYRYLYCIGRGFYRIYYRYKHHIYRILSLLCTLLSLVILWSELVLSTSLHSPIGILIGAYTHPLHRNSILIQIIVFIGITYMSICTYWSLFRMNLGWLYTLQGPQQSSPVSLVYNGQYFSRLQFSLGYNFLLTLNAPSLQGTAFKQMMSNIEVIQFLGTSFLVFVPLFIILVAIFTYLNVFQRLLQLIGLQSDDLISGPLCSCSCSWRRCCSNALPPLLGEELNHYEIGKKLVKNGLKQLHISHTNTLLSSGKGGANIDKGVKSSLPPSPMKSMSIQESSRNAYASGVHVNNKSGTNTKEYSHVKSKNTYESKYSENNEDDNDGDAEEWVNNSAHGSRHGHSTVSTSSSQYHHNTKSGGAGGDGNIDTDNDDDDDNNDDDMNDNVVRSNKKKDTKNMSSSILNIRNIFQDDQDVNELLSPSSKHLIPSKSKKTSNVTTTSASQNKNTSTNMINNSNKSKRRDSITTTTTTTTTANHTNGNAMANSATTTTTGSPVRNPILDTWTNSVTSAISNFLPPTLFSPKHMKLQTEELETDNEPLDIQEDTMNSSYIDSDTTTSTDRRNVSNTASPMHQGRNSHSLNTSPVVRTNPSFSQPLHTIHIDEEDDDDDDDEKDVVTGRYNV